MYVKCKWKSSYEQNIDTVEFCTKEILHNWAS